MSMDCDDAGGGKSRGTGEQARMTGEEEEERCHQTRDWVVDSAATSHMVGTQDADRADFVGYEQRYGTVTTSDVSSRLQIKGVGSLDGWEGVKLVENLDAPLLSVAAEARDG